MKTTHDDNAEEGFHDRVMARVDELSPSERAVTDFLLNRPTEAVTASAAQLARLTGTSDATVVRTARSLGYQGLRELKRAVLAMATARRDPAIVLDQRLEHISGARVFDQVIADSATMLQRMRAVVDPAAFDAAVDLVQGARRTIAYGAGPASTTARYFAIELNRLGRGATALEATGFRLADDLLAIGEGDVVVVFAPLRLFREIEALLAHTRDVGAPVIVVTEALGPAVRDRAAVVITTPSSTMEAAGENFASWVVAHSLVMELATRDRSGSVAARQRLNRLRREISGPDLDTDALGTEQDGPAE